MSARLAELDLETGVYTRGAFERELAFAVQVARRAAQPCSLLVVDVDDFQALRDVRGDLAADSCLEALAQRISAESNGAGPMGDSARTRSRCCSLDGRCPGPAPWPIGSGVRPRRPVRDGDRERGRCGAAALRALGQPARGGRDGLYPRQAGRPRPQRPPRLRQALVPLDPGSPLTRCPVTRCLAPRTAPPQPALLSP